MNIFKEIVSLCIYTYDQWIPPVFLVLSYGQKNFLSYLLFWVAILLDGHYIIFCTMWPMANS